MNNALRKLVITSSLVLIYAVAGFAQDKLVDYFGLFRVNVNDNRFSGDILKDDTTSEKRGAGGDFIFDLGINVQPNDKFRVSAILRAATTIGDNSANAAQIGSLGNSGIVAIFRQIRLEGLIKDVVKYELGDIDVKMSPYTLFNGGGLFTDYESVLYKKRRDFLEYENFNNGNSWRLQGLQTETKLGVGNMIDTLGLKVFATRVRPADEIDRQDRFVIGTGLNVNQSKNLTVGVNWITMFDNIGSSPDTIENYQNHVLTVGYEVGVDVGSTWLALEGESGMSVNNYSIEALNTSSEMQDFFIDLGINALHKPSGLRLEAGFINVGAEFTSPGAQTLRIRQDQTPFFMPTVKNNTAFRGVTMMDRLTDINFYNQQLNTGYMAYLPIFGNVQPYGKATPNRMGFDFQLEKTDSNNVLAAKVGGAVLSEVDGEGTADLRNFLQIKGGAVIGLGKLFDFEKDFELTLGGRYEATTRSGDAPVDFTSVLIDAGILVEVIEKFDVIFGSKYMIGSGNEALTQRDAFNNITGFTAYDVDLDQLLFSAGARIRFFPNSYASAEYNRFILTDIKDGSNSYNWGNLFVNFWLQF